MGVYGKINVYKDSSLLYSVDAHTLRAYAFTIQNDKILISDAETVYIMDLNGNVISSYEDADTSLFNKLKKTKTLSHWMEIPTKYKKTLAEAE